MSGIAASIFWESGEGSPGGSPGTGSSAEEARVRTILARMPHRGTEGTSAGVFAGAVLGEARFAFTVRESRAIQPARSGSWAVVFDGRLDDPATLAAALSLDRDTSDPALVAAGLERFGAEGLLPRLAGDFAFVAYDTAARALVAARDAFGARPLVFAPRDGRLLFASEVGALLPEVERGPDDLQFLRHLLGIFPNDTRTFHRNVSRVPAGFFLLATPAGSRLERHFVPPRAQRSISAADAAEAFREELARAVARRLPATGPVLVHLSGGLDSSSVACLADLALRKDPMAGAGLLSAVFPGQPWDERPYQEAVERELALPPGPVAVQGPPPLEPIHSDHPIRDPQPGMKAALEGAMTRSGARAVLAGFGGDELLLERGVFRELGMNRRLLTAAFEASRLGMVSGQGRRALFVEAVRLAAPDGLRRLKNRVSPHVPEEPPAWAGPRLRAVFAERQAAREPVPPRGRSVTNLPGTAAATWRVLNDGHVSRSLEYEELRAARLGCQMRTPYLDTALAAFVLSLPLEARRPHGLSKRLLRDAVSGILPDTVRLRRRGTHFDGNLLREFRALWPRLEAEIREGPLLREGWISPSLRLATGDTPMSWREARLLCNLAAFSVWRAL